jgi:hypothetical protein
VSIQVWVYGQSDPFYTIVSSMLESAMGVPFGQESAIFEGPDGRFEFVSLLTLAA